MSTARDINYQIDSFIDKLKRRQISGSYHVAIETAQLLKRFIAAARWSSPADLIEQIRQLGKRLTAAQPREFACGNIIRRVLAIIREEIDATANNEPMISSMFSLLDVNVPAAPKKQDKSHDLRPIVIEGIKELIDEVSNIDEGIEAIAIDLIHDNEYLLTPTPDSKTVLKFLLKARLKRKFTVVVTESFPNNTEVAHQFAKKLAESNIETVVIPDTHVFAIMSRIGKVIVGARAVFANGGTVSTAGVASVCECAKNFKTPVFSVAGLYKLSPQYPFDVMNFIEVGNSGKVLEYSDDLVSTAETTNPLYDYIPPENIDIYITNMYVYFEEWETFTNKTVVDTLQALSIVLSWTITRVRMLISGNTCCFDSVCSNKHALCLVSADHSG